MSFYYISEELADVLELSIEKRYNLSFLSKEFEGITTSVYGAPFCYEKKGFEILIEKLNKEYYEEMKKKVIKLIIESKEGYEKQITVCQCTINNAELGIKQKSPGIDRYIDQKEQAITQKNELEIRIKKIDNILANDNDFLYIYPSHERWLEESEHLIPEWKKETEKLQQRISILEEENKRLKESFKTSVLDIVKEYVYNFLPSFFSRK